MFASWWQERTHKEDFHTPTTLQEQRQISSATYDRTAEVTAQWMLKINFLLFEDAVDKYRRFVIKNLRINTPHWVVRHE